MAQWNRVRLFIYQTSSWFDSSETTKPHVDTVRYIALFHKSKYSWNAIRKFEMVILFSKSEVTELAKICLLHVIRVAGIHSQRNKSTVDYRQKIKMLNLFCIIYNQPQAKRFLHVVWSVMWNQIREKKKKKKETHLVHLQIKIQKHVPLRAINTFFRK